LSQQKKPDEIDLTILSYNILLPIHNKIIGPLLAFETRYIYQFDTLFPKLNPDILCLQEVTETYIEMLEKSKFFKNGYQHSGALESKRNGHHPLIISRLPMKILYTD